MNRRGFVGGMMAAGLGGNPPIRPDQAMQLQRTGAGSGPAPQSPVVIARRVIVIGPGAGVFTYDASNNLRSANVGQTTTDPEHGITCYAGFSTFNGHGAVISLFSSTLDAQLWYADTGTSTQGALNVAVASKSGTDPFGNVFTGPAISSQNVASILSELAAGTIKIHSIAGATFITVDPEIQLTDALAAASAPSFSIQGPVASAAGEFVGLRLFGQSNDLSKPSQAVLGLSSLLSPPTPTTKALLEVQGDVQAGNGLSVGQGLAAQTLVNGSTISTAGVTMQPVTCAAAVTGIILQAGTFDGQVIAIPNTGNFNATFAVAATSHVAAGTGGIIQPADTKLLFWVASTSLWYQVA